MNWALPIQFCPECGEMILKSTKDGEHAECIAWGIKLKKYRGKSDWISACIQNGERVNEVLKLTSSPTFSQQ